MNQKSGTGQLVLGIVGLLGAFFNGVTGLVFGFMGLIFQADPTAVDMTVNGQYMYGEEAAEYAMKLAKIFLGIAGGALVFCVLFIILAVVMFRAYNRISRERAAFYAQYRPQTPYTY